MKLSATDSELLLMIKSITNRDSRVTFQKDTYSILINATDLEEKVFKALADAIRGRLGDRLVKIESPQDRTLIAMVNYDEQGDAQAMLLRKKDRDAGEVYCRRLQEITAVQVRRDNIERVLSFVGGGEWDGEKVTFLNHYGMVFSHAYEGVYIIYVDENHFNIMARKAFEELYERK